MCNCDKPCKFHNKDNSLTSYALSCGYKEHSYLEKTGVTTELYKEANGYHVRQYNHKEGKRICWEIFTKLKEARRFYRQIVNCSKYIEKHFVTFSAH